MSVPHRSGGLVPVGFETVNVSAAQVPRIPAVVDAAVVTNASKSILSLQTSVLVGQRV